MAHPPHPPHIDERPGVDHGPPTDVDQDRLLFNHHQALLVDEVVGGGDEGEVEGNHVALPAPPWAVLDNMSCKGHTVFNGCVPRLRSSNGTQPHAMDAAPEQRLKVHICGTHAVCKVLEWVQIIAEHPGPETLHNGGRPCARARARVRMSVSLSVSISVWGHGHLTLIQSVTRWWLN